jgi:hypothetical protein
MRNVWEVLVVVGVVLLTILILSALVNKRPSRQISCASSLSEIVKACTTYQEPNDDFFPAFMQGCIEGQSNPTIPKSGQGSDYTFQPMPSLAALYPGFVDNVKIFRCPYTADRPEIALRYYKGARHTCFGFTPDPAETGTISTTALIPGSTRYTCSVDPAVYAGNEVSGNVKCSYFYDELTNPRKMKPDQAIACDADGQTWLGPNGKTPPYPSKGWTRTPRNPNHPNGQDVMYSDGHVKWQTTVYSSTFNPSRDANDNIFCPNSTNGVQWDADSDAYLWDGVNARGVQEVK